MGQSKRPFLRNVSANLEHDVVLLASAAQNDVHVSTKSIELNNNVEDATMLSSELIAGISAHPAPAVHRAEIRWPDLIAQLFLHVGALYGICQLFSVRWITIIWMLAITCGSIFGVTAGAHRLWSHKSYKAAWQLRLLLMFWFTIAGQRDAYTWALDHRVHHKYSETDSDPHDARRGFFFAHIGWVFLTPHPAVVEKRKCIDMSDLEADAIVMWQKRFFEPLFGLITIGLPVLVPWLCWNESLWLSFWVNFNFRFCVTLNIAFCVNSVAHMFGDRPFDKNISPVDNLFISLAAFGEGWHNYHHVFPWDYKTGEFGSYAVNLTSGLIDAFARVGWVKDRKTVSDAMIQRRVARCGDGSHYLSHKESHTNAAWGYGDNDIADDDTNELQAMH